MKPEKALELVGRYATLTKRIGLLKKMIGESLDGCKGFSGKRNDPFYSRETDSKNREIDLHLTAWYTPDVADDGYGCPEIVYEQIIKEEHGVQCPHCYAAHLSIEARKLARKELSAVKGAMTRSIN